MSDPVRMTAAQLAELLRTQGTNLRRIDPTRIPGSDSPVTSPVGWSARVLAPVASGMGVMLVVGGGTTDPAQPSIQFTVWTAAEARAIAQQLVSAADAMDALPAPQPRRRGGH